MDLSWIDDLAALSTQLSFSRAAQARNITQPAFSRRIRALENWVGCSLVERDTHRIRLTSAGVLFLEAGQEAGRQLQHGRIEALRASEEQSSIRFASTNALSLTFFPKWFTHASGMIATTPMSLVADNMLACERLMLEGGADFLLCHWHEKTATPLAEEGFEVLTLGTDKLVLITARNAANEPCYHLPTASNERTPFLAFDEQSGIGRIIASAGRDVQRGLNVNTVFKSHMALVLKNLVVEGRGVAWAPLSLVENDLGDNGTLALADPDISIAITIVLVRGRGRLSAAAREFWQRMQRLG